MTEIEKMFENAGIRVCKRKQGFTLKDCTDRECKECGYYALPPFTAEKQLLLIQWLAKIRPIHISFLFDKWIIEGIVRYGNKYDTFKDALSGYINHIWQGLTEEEKEEIRSILND